MAALVQEITEELQAIEEESLNDDCNSKATQEGGLEQEDGSSHLADDDGDYSKCMIYLFWLMNRSYTIIMIELNVIWTHQKLWTKI